MIAFGSSVSATIHVLSSIDQRRRPPLITSSRLALAQTQGQVQTVTYLRCNTGSKIASGTTAYSYRKFSASKDNHTETRSLGVPAERDGARFGLHAAPRMMA